MNNDKTKLRRKKINLVLNDEERRIITEKVIKYGYGNKLAAYVRAACIYENIYVQDVKGITEVFTIISKYIEEVRKIQGCIYGLYKNPNISKNEILILRQQNEKININVHKLVKAVGKIVTVDINKVKVDEVPMGE